MFKKEEVGNPTIFNDNYGIVFGGGGAKGAYQAGVIKALYECELLKNIKYASGSSIGAINMCLLPLENAMLGIILWNSINPLDILDIDEELLDGKEGLKDRSEFIKIINENIDFNIMKASEIEFYATISRLDDTKQVVNETEYVHLNSIDNDKIIKVLTASSALPLIYEAVEINGKYYRDGGLTDNLPIEPLYSRGVRNFIVVPLSTDFEFNYYRYPEAQCIIIKPSSDLGDRFTGTLNFSKDKIKLLEKIGYYDTIRTLKYYNTEISKSNIFREILDNSIENDYKVIETELICEKIEKNFKSNKRKIDSIMSKYGIDG